uniref:Uncharacterized protein n=1 Tax=Lotharella globosa TaxID=91324 RepID=A0A7S4DZJ7_9EUKA
MVYEDERHSPMSSLFPLVVCYSACASEYVTNNNRRYMSYGVKGMFLGPLLTTLLDLVIVELSSSQDEDSDTEEDATEKEATTKDAKAGGGKGTAKSHKQNKQQHKKARR